MNASTFTRASVGLAIAALCATGCSSGGESYSGPEIHVAAEELAALTLTFEGAPFEHGGSSYSASEMVEDFIEFAPVDSVEPGECREWHLRQSLVSAADVDGDGVVVSLGRAEVKGETYRERQVVLAGARAFDSTADAGEFFDGIHAAAEACPEGFSVEQSSTAPNGEGIVEVSYRVSRGPVLVAESTATSGAPVLIVTAQEVEFFGGDYISSGDTHLVFVQVGNDIVYFESFEDFDVQALSAEQRDALVDAAVDALVGARG